MSHHKNCDNCFNDCKISDSYSNKLVSIWKKTFNNAIILPTIGYPTNSNGVLTITHTIPNFHFISKSFLINNALYSVECIDGKYLNMYELHVPDILVKNSCKSIIEIYVDALKNNGLDIVGIHCDKWGYHVVKDNKEIFTIRHTKFEMDPKEFTNRTIKSLKSALKAIGH